MKSEHRPLYQVSEEKKKSIYDYIQRYAGGKYDIRYDQISQDFQISFKDQNNWEEFESHSFLVELAQNSMIVTPAKLDIFLKSHLVLRYNPIEEYFRNLSDWDGEDHIRELASYLSLKEPGLFVYHFRKWLVRTLKCAVEENYFNKQCLVLVHAEQNSGKSTWCRFLCPPALSRYFAEDMATDKDARIQLTRNFLINLDELSVLAKKEINALKAYFSKTMINERLPYDRKNSTLQRTCSFIGSTNRATFLNDETGSVRWLCFDLIGKIDFNYSQKIDINKVWAQAYHLAYRDMDFCPELSVEDILENEERNQTYQEPTMEEELVSKYFEASVDPSNFLTASDVITQISCINPRLNIISMGKALTSRGFQRVKDPRRQVYGYLIKPLFRSNPWEIP